MNSTCQVAIPPGPDCVDIVMPTHNCAPYLDDLMNSLVMQDFHSWRVVARDDRSSDETGCLLTEWQAKLGGRMMILKDSGAQNLGVIGNYNAVLAASGAKWVMSADPDDVWLPGKITQTLRAMREIESIYGAHIPLAVCTDARVVDRAGELIAPSYWRWSRMRTEMSSLTRTAMESVALGSTMMVNRALLESALPIDDGAPYQDWWLALVAVAFGHVRLLCAPTILYRRHGSNETSDPYGSTLAGALCRTFGSPGAPRRRLRRVVEQAAMQSGAFLKRYRGLLKQNDVEALESLANLFSMGPIGRRVAVLRHNLWFGSPAKNAGLLVLL